MRLSNQAVALAVLFSFLLSNASISAQKIDDLYNQKIKEFTTDARFLPSSVLNVTNDAKIPSPLKFFGSIIGAEGVMHHTTEIYNYYKKLAETEKISKIKHCIIYLTYNILLLYHIISN